MTDQLDSDGINIESDKCIPIRIILAKEKDKFNDKIKYK